MKTPLLLLFFLLNLSGCSLFHTSTKVSQDRTWQELWQSACPVSEGKGQIFISKRTYAFTYESIFNLKDNFWAIAMEVPVRGEETLVVPFKNQAPFSGSLLESLDKKSLKGLGPETLKAWKKSWLELLIFLQQRNAWSKNTWENGQCDDHLKCHGTDKNIMWKFSEEEIELKTISDQTKTIFSWNFKRINDELRFSQQVVTLRHQKNSQTISLHLYPTLCGK